MAINRFGLKENLDEGHRAVLKHAIEHNTFRAHVLHTLLQCSDTVVTTFFEKSVLGFVTLDNLLREFQVSEQSIHYIKNGLFLALSLPAVFNGTLDTNSINATFVFLVTQYVVPQLINISEKNNFLLALASYQAMEFSNEFYKETGPYKDNMDLGMRTVSTVAATGVGYASMRFMDGYASRFVKSVYNLFAHRPDHQAEEAQRDQLRHGM